MEWTRKHLFFFSYILFLYIFILYILILVVSTLYYHTYMIEKKITEKPGKIRCFFFVSSHKLQICKRLTKFVLYNVIHKINILNPEDLIYSKVYMTKNDPIYFYIYCFQSWGILFSP